MKEVEVFMDENKVDIEIINEYERKIGYKFPLEYKKLLSKHNGLYPSRDCFDFINIYNEKDERDIYFYYFKYENIYELGDSSSSMVYFLMDNEYLLKSLIPFGGCANGDIICFDYRNNENTDNPKIVLVYHDDYLKNDDGSFDMAINFISNSFEEFMDSLYEYVEEDENYK